MRLLPAIPISKYSKNRHSTGCSALINRAGLRGVRLQPAEPDPDNTGGGSECGFLFNPPYLLRLCNFAFRIYAKSGLALLVQEVSTALKAVVKLTGTYSRRPLE